MNYITPCYRYVTKMFMCDTVLLLPALWHVCSLRWLMWTEPTKTDPLPRCRPSADWFGPILLIDPSHLGVLCPRLPQSFLWDLQLELLWLSSIKLRRHDVKSPLVKFNHVPVLNYFCFKVFGFKIGYILLLSPLPSSLQSLLPPITTLTPRTMILWSLRPASLPSSVPFREFLSKWSSSDNIIHPSPKAHFRIDFQNNLLRTHNYKLHHSTGKTPLSQSPMRNRDKNEKSNKQKITT